MAVAINKKRYLAKVLNKNTRNFGAFQIELPKNALISMFIFGLCD